MGTQYVEGRAVEFSKSYEESGPGTPVFFILSPGVDPLKEVEALGKKLGFTSDQRNFHNISLGQGQEIVAEQAMDLAAKEGHWVVLQVCVCVCVFMYEEFDVGKGIYRDEAFSSKTFLKTIFSLVAEHSYNFHFKITITFFHSRMCTWCPNG